MMIVVRRDCDYSFNFVRFVIIRHQFQPLLITDQKIKTQTEFWLEFAIMPTAGIANGELFPILQAKKSEIVAESLDSC